MLINTLLKAIPRRSLSFTRKYSQHVPEFTRILGSSGVLTDKTDIEPYNNDWLGSTKGENSFQLIVSNELIQFIML